MAPISSSLLLHVIILRLLNVKNAPTCCLLSVTETFVKVIRFVFCLIISRVSSCSNRWYRIIPSATFSAAYTIGINRNAIQQPAANTLHKRGSSPPSHHHTRAGMMHAEWSCTAVLTIQHPALPEVGQGSSVTAWRFKGKGSSRWTPGGGSVSRLGRSDATARC